MSAVAQSATPSTGCESSNRAGRPPAATDRQRGDRLDVRPSNSPSTHGAQTRAAPSVARPRQGARQRCRSPATSGARVSLPSCHNGDFSRRRCRPRGVPRGFSPSLRAPSAADADSPASRTMASSSRPSSAVVAAVRKSAEPPTSPCRSRRNTTSLRLRAADSFSHEPSCASGRCGGLGALRGPTRRQRRGETPSSASRQPPPATASHRCAPAASPQRRSARGSPSGGRRWRAPAGSSRLAASVAL
mmetsp:Transcript_28899/g.86162  ORF Transcript_28899/g.86162 Transcript_28899/m.86162 type:complete len:246 (-) Transcript_28899:6-743(-)